MLARLRSSWTAVVPAVGIAALLAGARRYGIPRFNPEGAGAALAVVTALATLTLGLGGTQIVLFLLTVILGTLTVVPGRATRLQGAIHLVLFAAFLFLAMFP